jgi:hypothetical protein
MRPGGHLGDRHQRVGGHGDLVAGRGDQPLHELRDLRLVLDDQHATDHRWRALPVHRRHRALLGRRQVQVNRGAHPRLRLQRDVAADALHHARRGGQPQPGRGGPGGEERLQRPPAGLVAHARTGVLDDHVHQPAGRRALGELARLDDLVGRRHPQHAAVQHRVPGVRRQVHQRLLQRATLGLDRPDVRPERQVEADPLAQGPAEQALHVGEQVRDRDDLRPVALGTPERQQLMGQRPPGADRVHDVLGHLVLRRTLRGGRRDHVGGALHHGHQVVEVVRDAADQLAHAVQPAQVVELALEPPRVDVVGGVGDHAEHAAVLTVLVGQRHHAHPDAALGTVGAHQPGPADRGAPGPALGQPAHQLGLAVVVQEAAQGHPDQLGAGQAEDDADRLVRVRGHALGVELQHALRDGLQHPAVALLAGSQALDGPGRGQRQRQLTGDVAGQLDLGLGVDRAGRRPDQDQIPRVRVVHDHRAQHGGVHRGLLTALVHVGLVPRPGQLVERFGVLAGQHHGPAAGGQPGGEVVVGQLTVAVEQPRVRPAQLLVRVVERDRVVPAVVAQQLDPGAVAEHVRGALGCRGTYCRRILGGAAERQGQVGQRVSEGISHDTHVVHYLQ